ncbi:MAG: AhpC/TSA family protein [Bacteroidales bacterium]|nr:AhpC/TSA family protein [Bacteroidales bacterium]
MVRIRKFFFIICVFVVSGFSAFSQQLPNGSVAPNFKAVDVNGDTVELYKIIKHQIVVLTFYRGQWCPYCNKYLSNLQDSLSEITSLNAVLIAVSPENNENINLTIYKTGANFILIYDENHKIMDDYQVTWNLSAFKNAMYKMGGVNINEASGNDDRALPITATYIIDTKRKIYSGYYDDDFRVRMTAAEIIKTLEKIKLRSVNID